MADILLPGTDINIIEKYPPGRRADFPDFGSVCKTAFSKGTIKEFKAVTDNPDDLLKWEDGAGDSHENRDVRVEPLVKVTGDFGESDYIPLFYHPKAEYWDDETADPPILATDFDEETGAFKQAWQSFRVDDEVAVMLKEGIPVAVVGFADGVPRVGEDIFQMEYNSVSGAAKKYQWQGSVRGPETFVAGRGYPYGTFNVEHKGPDGVDLGLKQEALKICDTGIVNRDIEFTDVYGSVFNYHYEKRYSEWFFAIGPVAYILQAHYTYARIIETYAWGGGVDLENWVTKLAVLTKLYSDEVKEEAISLGADHNSLAIFNDSGPGSNTWGLNPLLTQFLRPPIGGSYSAAKLDAINPEYGPYAYYGYKMADWPGWIFQPDFTIRLQTSYVSEDYSYTTALKMDPATLKIFTRPHTKEELQAANMWPAA